MLHTCLSFLVAMSCSLVFVLGALAQSSHYPIEVDIWDPPFNTERMRVLGEYEPFPAASKPWKICVSIPHLKDAYWLAVNFSVIDEAKRLGVAVKLFEARGYGNLEQQRTQVRQCMDSGADGLILSAVDYDGFTDLIAEYAAEGRPVVDLINGVASKDIAARVAATYWDTGNLAGGYLARLQEGESTPLRVAWFPGPEGAGWVAAADQGFNDAIAGTDIELLTTLHGDTGRDDQAELIEKALAAFPDLDFIVGTTVTAEAAIKILRQKGLTERIRVLPYYYGPGVHMGIARGLFPAAPTDKQGFQARLAMDTMVRVLEGAPYDRHVGARVELIERKDLKDFDESSTLPPHGFRPIFSYGEW